MPEQTKITTINGVDLKTVTRLAREVDTDADRSTELENYSRRCRVRWINGYHSQVYTRDTPPFHTDEPEWLGGSNAGMAASEALLGAVGACIVTGFAANAALRSVEIDELEVEVEGAIDIPSFLGLGDGDSGYSALNVTIYVDCDAEGELLEEIAFRAVDLSPVVNTVRKPVTVNTTLKELS